MHHKACQPHTRDEVQIGAFTVKASSIGAPTHAFVNHPVEAALFLDSQWNGRIGTDFPSSDLIRVYAWPDFGVIDISQLHELVGWVTQALESDKTVDVGCLGGHGRTGSLLAALVAEVESRSGDEAVNDIRIRYCIEAVEGKQDRLVADYASTLEKGT